MKKSFSFRLEELRGNHSQKEFAKILGIPLTSYTNWVLRMRSPSIDVLESICTQMGVSADWLLGLTDDRIAPKSANVFSVNGDRNAVLNGHAVNSTLTFGTHDCATCPYSSTGALNPSTAKTTLA